MKKQEQNKKQELIKKQGNSGDFEKKANIILIAVTGIIFCAIGLGVYLSLQKPVEKSANDILDSALASKGKEDKTKETPKAEQKEQASKVEEKPNKGVVDLAKQKTITVDIKTAKGDIKVALYPDLMPITVENFIQLVKKNFYNSLSFHRVEDWVIQGGDPKGNGTGGSDKTIKLETNPNLKNVRGAIAMARSDAPDSASSQFYILKKDASWLDNGYAVFGKVISGMEIVDKIAAGDKMTEIKEVK
ncbi:MAG: peptidylprolyl isomerase [Deltaproteobacteria bacterium]